MKVFLFIQQSAMTKTLQTDTHFYAWEFLNNILFIYVCISVEVYVWIDSKGIGLFVMEITYCCELS